MRKHAARVGVGASACLDETAFAGVGQPGVSPGQVRAGFLLLEHFAFGYTPSRRWPKPPACIRTIRARWSGVSAICRCLTSGASPARWGCRQPPCWTSCHPAKSSIPDARASDGPCLRDYLALPPALAAVTSTYHAGLRCPNSVVICCGAEMCKAGSIT
jgi:hypothetical protein